MKIEHQQNDLWYNAFFSLFVAALVLLDDAGGRGNSSSYVCTIVCKKKRRHVQGSNLCGINPMDFKSIALTTRPTCLVLTCTLTFDDHGTLPRRHVLLINFDF